MFSNKSDKLVNIREKVPHHFAEGITDIKDEVIPLEEEVIITAATF